MSSPILATPSPTNAELFDVLTPKAGVPLQSSVSTPATDGGSEAGENVTGRERRTRKSVNYAEPKLNTYDLLHEIYAYANTPLVRCGSPILHPNPLKHAFRQAGQLHVGEGRHPLKMPC